LNESARIDSYALIGDLHTAALISEYGSLNWLCWPDFDSEACFARLLGGRSHGFWSISPTTTTKIERRYLPGTLIVETVPSWIWDFVVITSRFPNRVLLTTIHTLILWMELRLHPVVDKVSRRT
jgi:GH15 family glucan-1,4-alpha-glucosidase